MKGLRGGVFSEFYAALPWRYKLYVNLRLISCPLEKIAKAVPETGKILDLGCGVGLLSFLLASASNRRDILGVDCREERILLAHKISFGRGGRGIDFKHADIVSWEYGSNYDCIILSDILYQLPLTDKKKVLQKSFSALSSTGVLVVKEVDLKPSLKMLLCYLQERSIARIAGLNTRRVEAMSAAGLCAIIREAGFKVRNERIGQGYPYPHILCVGRKDGQTV